MEKVTIKEISEYIDKDVNTISGWNTKQPKLLELVKLGALCKKNNLDIEQIRKLVEIKEAVRGAGK